MDIYLSVEMLLLGFINCYIVADCGSLPNPRDGQVTFEPAGTTVFRSRAIYSCNFGFSLQGDKTRVCQADETWSGSEPKCVRKLYVLSIF